MIKIISKTILIFFLLVFFSNLKIVAKSRGEVKYNIKFNSTILDTFVNYSIYLPASYDKEKDKKYPVLYLLHGYTDDETTWVKNGWVDQAEDKGVITGEAEEMIIVMPDAGLKWYVNHPNGNWNYEDMFIKEFIPYIEKTYKIKSTKEYRSVGGLSMGGYGALGYSMRHTELFGTCIAYSSAIRPNDEAIEVLQKEFDYLYHPLYGKNVEGEARISKHWNENNPIYLAQRLDSNKLESVNWYITCGDDDFLSYGNSTLHKIFQDRKIQHEYRVYDGKHNWNYWRTYIGEGLKFISQYIRLKNP